MERGEEGVGAAPDAGVPSEARGGQELFALAYDELLSLARQAMAREPRGHTLQTTALLNEAWLRLSQAPQRRFENREHFLAVASRAMRSVLVDHARRRGALKRDGGQRVELDGVLDLFEESSTDLLALDEALSALERLDPKLSEIVELRFFGGLSHPAIAQALEMPLRSVERGWVTARSWLYARLADGGGPSGDPAAP